MKLGFIGTGKIASALVRGFNALETQPRLILLSPRNRRTSQNLADCYDNIRVARDNQSVVDGSTSVFIALRPDVAEIEMKSLRFSSGHTLISLVPTLTMEQLGDLSCPATSIFRAVPLPPVAEHMGPILIHPDGKSQRNILAGLGQIFPIGNESQLHILWALTCVLSPFFSLLDLLTQRLVRRGIPEDIARNYSALLFQSQLAVAAARPGVPFDVLAEEAATPGGLNEFTKKLYLEGGGGQVFLQAFDAVVSLFPGLSKEIKIT